VTRGTRPKKPSSSRGFGREAHGVRGVRGFWGLKTENCKFFSLFPSRQQLPNFFNNFIIFFRTSAQTVEGREGEGAGEGREGEGGEGDAFA
jgi:hypothetical protein